VRFLISIIIVDTSARYEWMRRLQASWNRGQVPGWPPRDSDRTPTETEVMELGTGTCSGNKNLFSAGIISTAAHNIFSSI